MSFTDPFRSRFEVFGREPQATVDDINQQPFEKLRRLLDVGEGGDGRVILLRAPRAGYGKTSLLGRLAREFSDSHYFIRVNLVNGRRTDAAHVLEYVLQALCQVVPESPTLTNLDYLARQILAIGLEPLVASGEVPCQDRDGALNALRDQPIETFDFHHDRAVTAHWTKSNFEILGPRLAAELARFSGASLREASYWVELLFRFATTAPDNVERARLLFETVFRSDLQNQSESAGEERLHGLLALVGSVTNLVLIVDDTEGLSTHPPDALALASFLTNLSQCCPGTLVVLSVNEDIWQSAFLPLLPGGLADRLTEFDVRLAPLSEEQARALIRERAGDRAEDVIAKIDWSNADLYARNVLKLASAAWESLDTGDAELSVVPKEADHSDDAEEDAGGLLDSEGDSGSKAPSQLAAESLSEAAAELGTPPKALFETRTGDQDDLEGEFESVPGGATPESDWTAPAKPVESPFAAKPFASGAGGEDEEDDDEPFSVSGSGDEEEGDRASSPFSAAAASQDEPAGEPEETGEPSNPFVAKEDEAIDEPSSPFMAAASPPQDSAAEPRDEENAPQTPEGRSEPAPGFAAAPATSPFAAGAPPAGPRSEDHADSSPADKPDQPATGSPSFSGSEDSETSAPFEASPFSAPPEASVPSSPESQPPGHSSAPDERDFSAGSTAGSGAPPLPEKTKEGGSASEETEQPSQSPSPFSAPASPGGPQLPSDVSSVFPPREPGFGSKLDPEKLKPLLEKADQSGAHPSQEAPAPPAKSFAPGRPSSEEEKPVRVESSDTEPQPGSNVSPPPAVPGFDDSASLVVNPPPPAPVAATPSDSPFAKGASSSSESGEEKGASDREVSAAQRHPDVQSAESSPQAPPPLASHSPESGQAPPPSYPASGFASAPSSTFRKPSGSEESGGPAAEQDAPSDPTQVRGPTPPPAFGNGPGRLPDSTIPRDDDRRSEAEPYGGQGTQSPAESQGATSQGPGAKPHGTLSSSEQSGASSENQPKPVDLSVPGQGEKPQEQETPFKPVAFPPEPESSPFAKIETGRTARRTELPPKKLDIPPSSGPQTTPFEPGTPPGASLPPSLAPQEPSPPAAPRQEKEDEAPAAASQPKPAEESAPSSEFSSVGNQDEKPSPKQDEAPSPPPSFASQPSGAGGDSDQDKVDELLRQFKERYGRR